MAGGLHLEFLVAVRVGLHGLADERGQFQLLLFQRGPELRGQDYGRQGQRGLFLLAHPRLLLADVAVDPAGVGHVLGRGWMRAAVRQSVSLLFKLVHKEGGTKVGNWSWICLISK